VASAPTIINNNSTSFKTCQPPQSPSLCGSAIPKSPGSPQSNLRPQVAFGSSPMRRSRPTATSIMMSPNNNNSTNGSTKNRKPNVNDLLTEQAPPAQSCSPRVVARATLRDMIHPNTERNVLLRKSSSERWSETTSLSQKVKSHPQAPSSAYTALTTSPNKKINHAHPSSPFSSSSSSSSSVARIMNNKYMSPHVSSHSHGDAVSLGSSSSTSRYQV
jgi:hypothetical protein